MMQAATDLLTGIELAIAYSLPVLVFSVLYRLGKVLDLALDALLAAAGVTFVIFLRGGDYSFLMSLVVALGAVVLVSACRFFLTEIGQVPPEVGTLLLAFAVFKFLEIQVGEAISLTGVEGRFHSSFSAATGLPEFTLSIILAASYCLLLEFLVRSRMGLYFRAISDNPVLTIGIAGWKVRGVFLLITTVLIGVAGVMQADREGGVFSGFRISRVVDAFVVAELTSSIARRFQDWGESSNSKRRGLFLTIARSSVVLQALLGTLFLGALSYVLISNLHPALPSLVESLLVLVLIMRPGERVVRIKKSSRNDHSFRLHPAKFIARDLDLEYRGDFKANSVLKSVNFELPTTGLFIFWGDNGVGKSSLLQIIAGLLRPDKGMVLLAGDTLEGQVGYIDQNPLRSIAPSLTVRENLDLALARAGSAPGYFQRINRKAAADMLDQFLQANALLEGIDRSAYSFSGGQIQVLATVCAVISGSKVILADEPVKMLDAYHRRLIEEQLLKLAKDRLVIMTSHEPRLDLAPRESHFLIKDGKLFEGVAEKPEEPAKRQEANPNYGFTALSGEQ